MHCISSFKIGQFVQKNQLLLMTRFVLVNSCYNRLGECVLFVMTITLFHCSNYSCSYKLELTFNSRKGHNRVKVRPSTADVVFHVIEQTDISKDEN